MSDLPASPIPELRTVELGAGSEPLLQAFFEANPAYFLSVQGEPPGANEAHEEIHEALPSGWSYTKKLVFGYVMSSGALVAMANVVTDLLAKGVWHIGTFILATARHGTGQAQVLYAGLEQWARDSGAQWLRLGVVAGNTRAERFWLSQGFAPLRTREGVQFGNQARTVIVMYKALANGTKEQYMSVVPRDRPESQNAPSQETPSK